MPDDAKAEELKAETEEKKDEQAKEEKVKIEIDADKEKVKGEFVGGEGPAGEGVVGEDMMEEGEGEETERKAKKKKDKSGQDPKAGGVSLAPSVKSGRSGYDPKAGGVSMKSGVSGASSKSGRSKKSKASQKTATSEKSAASKKRRRKRKRAAPKQEERLTIAQILAKKEEIYGFQTLYREWGYYITRKEQYERALKIFDHCLSKYPNDKRALIGRSITRAKAVQYAGALEDINKALHLDPNDLIVLAHKALNTYLSCEFEDALVQNLKRVPQRKKPDSFVMGVMHCTEAIENCIGERAGRPLRDHFKIIRKLAWKKAREEKKPYEPKDRAKKKRARKRKMLKELARKGFEPVVPLKLKHLKPVPIPTDLDDGEEGEEVTAEDLQIRDSLYSHKSEQDVIPPPPPFPYRPLQRYTTNIENYMAEKYLDKLYLDKIFLKELKYNPGVSSPNKEGTKKILKLSKEGYKTLSYKQELLRTRRPFYFIKFQETKLSVRLKQKQEEERKMFEEAYSKDAEDLLDKLKDAAEEEKAKVAMDYAEKLLSFCMKKPKKYLPRRDQYLKEMYTILGKVFLDLKRLNYQQFEWDQEKRVLNMLGIPPERIPSADSVLEQFKDAFVDYRKQIILAEDRVRKAASCEELAWLYHELARFHIELKHPELSRIYARKCIQEGYRTKNLDWVINAMMIVARINIFQHNRNDARGEINDAIKVATKMDNKLLVEYLYKTLESIEKIDFEDVHGIKVVEKREQQIIQMMGETGMKEEVSHMFRKMSAMPASRRMSVMPGVRFQDMGLKEKGTRKMSIMPGSKPPEEVEDNEPKKKPERTGFRDYLDV